MTFVSRNPQASNSPDVAEGTIRVSSEKVQVGTEFVGYYKHKYIDPTYKKENYILKDKNGQDYLFYNCTSLAREFQFYNIGELLKLVYRGKVANKTGPYRGQLAHCWDVSVDNSVPSDDKLIASLQAEVKTRQAAVMGASQTQQFNQPSQFNQNTPPVFVQPAQPQTPSKQHNPFG